MNQQTYIQALEKEIDRLTKLITFYEEIILSNEELKEMYRDKLRKHAGEKDRRTRQWQKR